MKIKNKPKFSSQLYIESIYDLCDQMKDSIKKGKVEAADPELLLLEWFIVDIDNFLNRYFYENRSE